MFQVLMISYYFLRILRFSVFYVLSPFMFSYVQLCSLMFAYVRLCSLMFAFSLFHPLRRVALPAPPIWKLRAAENMANNVNLKGDKAAFLE